MWRRCFTTGRCGNEAASIGGRKWDAVVVGGGHNGLVAAAYLARGGLSVAVLERRHVIGGAAVTEEIVPGFRFSRCSYLQSLLRPTIISDLELKRHGLKLLKPLAGTFTPCANGRYLLLGYDDRQNYDEISKFSILDAEAYPRYESHLNKFWGIMDFLLDSRPPEALNCIMPFGDRVKDKLDKSVFWARCLRHILSLGQDDMVALLDLLFSPTSKVLNRWFETDVLKAAIAADATVGTMESINSPGSGYVLLHHVMGQTDGQRNVWSHVEGGMGSVSLAISRAAQELGVHIATNAEVMQLLARDDGLVTGVLLADGTEVKASVVLSNATPHKTFMDLVPRKLLCDDFIRAIKFSDYSSGTTKINVAIDRLPQFSSYSPKKDKAGPHHTATIRIGCESMECIASACQDACNGVSSRRPIMEMTIPSTLDRTLSPAGKHVVGLFTQYTPYKPADGSWEDPSYRERYAQRCFGLIDEYAPGFSSSVIGYDMLTPPDLEREIGLTGGNIFHGAMGLDSLFMLRPIKGWSGYRTPVRGLYMCGSGCHPGGGVMGAPGRNAAHVVLDDMKKRPR